MDPDTQSRLKPWAWYTAGAHLLIGCAWPLLGSESYQKVMGRKEDMWLMTGTSMLFGVTGSVIARAAKSDRITPEIAQLAIGASVAIAGMETVNVARGRIPLTNLLDTAGHLSIAGGWMWALRRSSREQGR
jgi:hypothetical protein